MPEDTMLQEAIQALRQGQRSRARDLLTRLLRTNQSNAEYWLWMSAAVDSHKEQVYCLEKALKLDPRNSAVRQGLVLLGAMAPQTPPVVQALQRRKWSVLTQDVPRPTGLRGLWANPATRAMILAAVTLVVTGLVCAGIFGLTWGRRLPVALRPTSTHGPTPTYTRTPTPINYTPPASPLPSASQGPTPLWMLLPATYTPTPIYVNTPHPVNEAFRVAQRDLASGNLDAALQNMQQASALEKGAADIPYTMGEVWRLRGRYKDALEAYAQALDINPNFAPAYLGRARTRLKQDRRADVKAELQKAIEKDPAYGEAYLERAAYWLARDDFKAALNDLKQAEKLLPGSPLVFLYRAQIALQQKDARTALQNAQQANQLDLTLLESYLVLGQAAALNDDPNTMIRVLKTYVTYNAQNATAWALLGQAYFKRQQCSLAVEALDQALKLDDQNAEGYLYRGLCHLEVQAVDQAEKDLFQARLRNQYSFEAALGFGRALFANGKLREARDLMVVSLDLAKKDEERAQVYYWRAQVIEAIGNAPTAALDWQALLNLPEKAMPADWRQEARKHVQARVTPSPTPQPSRTSRPSSTPPAPGKPTRTSRPTSTRQTPPAARATTAVTPTPTAVPVYKVPGSPTPSVTASRTPGAAPARTTPLIPTPTR